MYYLLIIYFSTLRYPLFNLVFSYFYVNNIYGFRKIVPLNVFERLTAIGLAFFSNN